MEKDFAYRLCTLSAQQLGAAMSMNCAAAGTVGRPQLTAAAAALRPATACRRSGRACRHRPAVQRPPAGAGTWPVGRAGHRSAVRAVPGRAGMPRQYDQAMNLMSRAQYAEALRPFRAYADANPGDTDLSPQAIYWVGNISFIRQDYARRARPFAEVIKKYPKSPARPDAMLKLAQSFMSHGPEIGRLHHAWPHQTKYPNAPPQTLASAASLRKTACSK
jgi:TolA-binding protein